MGSIQKFQPEDRYEYCIEHMVDGSWKRNDRKYRDHLVVLYALGNSTLRFYIRTLDDNNTMVFKQVDTLSAINKLIQGVPVYNFSHTARIIPINLDRVHNRKEYVAEVVKKQNSPSEVAGILYNSLQRAKQMSEWATDAYVLTLLSEALMETGDKILEAVGESIISKDTIYSRILLAYGIRKWEEKYGKEYRLQQDAETH